MANKAMKANSMGFLDCVKADLYRHYEAFSWPLLLRSIAFKRTFTPVFTLRLCQALNRKGWRRILQVPARLLHRWATSRAAIDLPWQTTIGPGFRIVHGFGFVTNAKSKFGSNVTVFQGVTVGQKDRLYKGTRETEFPVIGDEVFLGAYAMVLGVEIGKGAIVAPLSVVVDSIDPHTAVSGNPAKVIKENVESYISKPWRDAEIEKTETDSSCVHAASESLVAP